MTHSFPTRRSADLDTGITDQLGGHRTWYKDVIEHALRYARLDKHVAQSTGDGRGNGRRLEHYSVTKGQSRGNFPGGDRNGEVPGRDQPQDRKSSRLNSSH